MPLLTDNDRKESIYLGDGLYMLDHGYQIELFASDGIMKNNAVYLDDNVLASFLEIVKQRHERKI